MNMQKLIMAMSIVLSFHNLRGMEVLSEKLSQLSFWKTHKESAAVKKEWQYYKTFPTYAKDFIIFLKLAQKQYHLPLDLIKLISLKIIHNKNLSVERCFMLACYQLYCRFSENELIQEFKALYMDENTRNLIITGMSQKKSQMISVSAVAPFLDTTIQGKIKIIIANKNISALTKICNQFCVPNNELWNYAFLYACNIHNWVIPHEELIKKIAQYAHINAHDFYNETALMHCAAHQPSSLVKWLLEQGADKNIKNYQGHTALDYASANKRADIVALLSDTPHTASTTGSFLGTK